MLNEHFLLIGHIIGLFTQVCLSRAVYEGQSRAAQLTAISHLQTAPTCPL